MTLKVAQVSQFPRRDICPMLHHVLGMTLQYGTKSLNGPGKCQQRVFNALNMRMSRISMGRCFSSPSIPAALPSTFT
ncbi:protein of unknown function (plasmid) [Cupriavidus neocaledonicus]|uniref:Uncharacterized protein n=1 Tax=Cupriavidus neocaledonicus TaxID=1040979 RepID=A0A375HSZ4_9BURK|nr:hypothetical protein CBM2605_B110014 [Cupriavidus neocaledonicus]SPD59870.1 protein of unknown function [Cupriavidus neocaledonicus]